MTLKDLLSVTDNNRVALVSGYVMPDWETKIHLDFVCTVNNLKDGYVWDEGDTHRIHKDIMLEEFLDRNVWHLGITDQEGAELLICVETVHL